MYNAKLVFILRFSVYISIFQESDWGEMRWNYMWQVVLKAYIHVVDGKFDSDQMTCKKCSKKVMIASTNLYKAKVVDALQKLNGSNNTAN